MHAIAYLLIKAVVPVLVVLQALLCGETDETSWARIVAVAVDLPHVLVQLAEGGEGLAAELPDIVVTTQGISSYLFMITTSVWNIMLCY